MKASAWFVPTGGRFGLRPQPRAGALSLRGLRIAALIMVLAVLQVGAASPAGADPTLYLVDSQFGSLVTRIFEVETSTGALTVRGDLGTAYTPLLGLAAASRLVLYAAGTDTSASNLCAGNFACLLMRLELDPLSTLPAAVTVVGPMTENGLTLAGVTGLTFRRDGKLYAVSQDNDGLYVLDTKTAVATRLGTVDIDLHGGDITFDAEDRLWLWTNLGDATGLYQVDPATGHATLIDLQPFLDMSGLAAVGHTNELRSVSPVSDDLYAIDPLAGITGDGIPLTLAGNPFDHRRGDLDSPFCEADSSCDDGDICTVDQCTPGGCAHPAILNCCHTDQQCGNVTQCLVPRCIDNACSGGRSVACGPTPLPARPPLTN